MLHFNICTIFPDFFTSPFSTGLLGKAFKNGLVSCSFHNPRLFAHNKHMQVDDRPFGGGPGMVMQVPPLFETINNITEKGKILLMSASGKELTGKISHDLAHEKNITIICGRYEGIDARLQELINCTEIRICKAILNGGETAALAAIEAVCRFLPGFLSKKESLEEESFSQGLLEYPQYTRPFSYKGINVPEVLLSGNHAEILQWRREKALVKTLETQPDILTAAPLTKKDAEILKRTSRFRPGKNLSFCLFHYPVFLDKHQIGVSSLTNLDIHDIARISQSYGLGPFFVLTPYQKQLDLLEKILQHWLASTSPQNNQDRKKALELVKPVRHAGELKQSALEYYGETPAFILTSANWPQKDKGNFINFSDLRKLIVEKPVIICLGTARGIAAQQLDFEFLQLKPLRFLDDNHLSVRSAAAIIADRVLGDFL